MEIDFDFHKLEQACEGRAPARPGGRTDATSASLPCNGRTWSLPCNGRTWTRQARPSRAPARPAEGGTDGRDKRVPPVLPRGPGGGGGRPPPARPPPPPRRPRRPPGPPAAGGRAGADTRPPPRAPRGPGGGGGRTRQARPSRQNRLSGMKQLARTCPFTTVEETEMDRPLNCLNGSSHWPVSATVISPVSAWKDSTTSSRGE